MDFDELLESRPKLHTDQHGELVSWAIGDEVLRYIYSEACKGSRSAETGSGITTAAFALGGTEHTAVCPYQDEVERVRSFFRAEGISLDKMNFAVGRSELVLPGLDLHDLDLFLIDGRHGFPTPFIDWFYGAAALRVGGLMIVDDTQLRTGALLVDFLTADPCWRTAQLFEKTAVFEKVVEGVHDAEFNDQPWCMEA